LAHWLHNGPSRLVQPWLSTAVAGKESLMSSNSLYVGRGLQRFQWRVFGLSAARAVVAKQALRCRSKSMRAAGVQGGRDQGLLRQLWPSLRGAFTLHIAHAMVHTLVPIEF